MTAPMIFITGTDTGVGKTVLGVLLARHLRAQGYGVAALKPICSGDRADARQLRDATNRLLPLDLINPWHFRNPIAPLLAARHQKRKVRLRQVVRHIRHVARQCEVVLVEGAGGLLTPLGQDFDSRDLIEALGAIPLVVCADRLGAINQARLAYRALPPAQTRNARIVLSPIADGRRQKLGNAVLLGQYLGHDRVAVLPSVTNALTARLDRPALQRILQNLITDAVRARRRSG